MTLSKRIKKKLKSLGFHTILLYYRLYINTLGIYDIQLAAEKAVAIFKIPRNEKLKKEEKYFLKENFKEYVESNGKKIAVYHWPGAGKPILLIHGWESSTIRWHPYIDDLQKRGFDIYALDAPAHGLSEGREFTPEHYADAIARVAEKYKLEILLGHSAGAYSALIYAHRDNASESLKHLLLLAPTGRIKDFINKSFDILSLKPSIRKAYFRGFELLYRQELSYYNSDNLIKQVSLPGLLIHDKNDRTLPYEDSVLIAKNWPQGKFITTTGYGHRLKSTEVSQYIFDYLDKIVDS